MGNDFDLQKEYEQEQKQADRLRGYAGSSTPMQQNGNNANASFRESTVFMLIGGVFLAACLILALICFLVVHFVEKSREKCTETTTAIVIDNILEDDTYAPLFRYTAKNGKTYEEKSSYSSRPARYDIGDEAEIKYQPDDPENFYEPDDDFLWIVKLVLGGLSGLFFIIGAVFLGIGIKTKRSESSWLA